MLSMTVVFGHAHLLYQIDHHTRLTSASDIPSRSVPQNDGP